MTGEQLIVKPVTTDEGIFYDQPNQPKVSKNSIFELHKEPSMPQVLDLISQLGQNKEIILKAKGNSISNAVTLANLLTSNRPEEESKFQEKDGLNSTIEMVIKITNS